MAGDKVNRSKKKSAGTEGGESSRARCNWNVHEERFFITALKGLVADGWRCENGWKPKYLTALEEAFKKLCPGTDKRAHPHMHSKMGTFKRDYNTLIDFLNKSGSAFDYSTKTVDATPELWAELKQHDENTYNTLRNKSWPYYEDWLEIFGNDRANGEFCEDGDVTNLTQGAYAPPDAIPDDQLLNSTDLVLAFSSPPFEANEKYSTHDESSTYQEETSYAHEGGKRKHGNTTSKSADESGSAEGKKKRKHASDFDDLIVELRELSRDSNAAIRELGETLIRPGQVLQEKKTLASDLIRSMKAPTLTTIERLKVVQIITRDPASVDCFLDSSVPEREIMVESIARGEM